MRVLLSAEPPRTEPAVDLLLRRYERIDVAAALALLPDDLAAELLYPCLQGTIRARTERARQLQVAKSLLRAENMRVAEQLAVAKSKFLTVDDGSMCTVCGRRLGLAAFVYLTTNGYVVHYACLDRVDAKQRSGL
jgi:hypothetical protein